MSALRIPGRAESNAGAELLAKAASSLMGRRKIQSARNFASQKQITRLAILEDHACEPTQLNSNRIMFKMEYFDP